MTLIEIFLIGVGLSMDAFAVSVGKGLTMKRIDYRYTLIISLFFGVFQAGMPAIGWFLASGFYSYIEAFDHWIAFGLLVIIGGKMLWDAFHDDDEADDGKAELSESGRMRINIPEIVLLAIATSIDALAVGIMFASMGVGLMPAIVIIGVTTFVISFGGVAIGNRFGSKYERKATIAGGLVLIAIGIKVLAEHMLA